MKDLVGLWASDLASAEAERERVEGRRPVADLRSQHAVPGLRREGSDLVRKVLAGPYIVNGGVLPRRVRT